MTFRRALGALFVLSTGLGVCARAAAAEETILFYEAMSRTIAMRPAAQGGNAVTDTSRTEIVVALGDRRLVVYEPGRAWIYDFERGRVVNVDTREHIYSDWSLHAFVAFGESEMNNRLAIRRKMMASRPGPGPSVLDLESLFSMKAPGTRPGKGESLADSSRGGTLRWMINRSLAVEMTPTDTAFAPGRAAMFNRFLAFRAHLHPEVRRGILRAGKVPRLLSYRYRDYNDETQVRLRLTRISTAPDNNDPSAGSRRVDVADPGLQELNQRLEACRACSLAGDWLGESRRFEAAALDSGRTLDAALARAERVIGACETDSIWPAKIEARVHTDTLLAAIRAGTGWRDSAQAHAALLRLDSVSGQGLPKRYLIDLLRGRARLGAGDFELGTYLMMGGIGGNPCMAGAWLDLAQGYLDAYQPVLAWLCFEAAEQVSVKSCAGRFAQRAALERGLEQRHPDFFE